MRAWVGLCVVLAFVAGGIESARAGGQPVPSGAAARPDDLLAANMKCELAIRRGDFGEAIRRFEALLQTPVATPTMHNNAAWLHLFTGTDLQGALALIRKAAGPDRERISYGQLNTIAALEAELGELGAAKLDGWQSMENIGRAVPLGPDWLIYGMIAEQLGLRDDAIAAYRRIPRSNQLDGVFALAQRRLTRLGVKP